jgi:hypothetical protein
MGSSFFHRKCITGLIAGIVLAVPAMQAKSDSTLVIEGSKAASLDSCVAPTDEIRRYHMDNLVHGRDDVVIDGDRTGEYSIAGCVDCHAGPRKGTNEYLPVNAEGQFCETCHDYVAVSLDCFQCHRSTPGESGSKIGAVGLNRLPRSRLGAVSKLPSHESLELYANEPTEIQRD